MGGVNGREHDRVAIRRGGLGPVNLTSGAKRFEVGGDLTHLDLRKVLNDAVHNRCSAQRALNDEHLLHEISGVLAREARKYIIAARLRTMAGRAGRDALCSDALFKDLLTAGRELRIAWLGRGWCLRGIVGRDGL